ncbi:MAG: DNA starvation/stationary phase protection protein [Bacteroidia bacterium]|jgi:starvation-inducible DNA-binding protein
MKPNIGISEKNLSDITTLLSSVLSNEMVLYVKTRKYHWNVTGESFMELHQLFETHYKKLEKSIDEIAERISKLGGNTIGTMKEFLELSSIEETPGSYPPAIDMIVDMLKDHETVIIQLRKYIDECSNGLSDAGTADFLTGLLKEHETISWTLRRYLN